VGDRASFLVIYQKRNLSADNFSLVVLDGRIRARGKVASNVALNLVTQQRLAKGLEHQNSVDRVDDAVD
jgi:hypothetical protein